MSHPPTVWGKANRWLGIVVFTGPQIPPDKIRAASFGEFRAAFSTYNIAEYCHPSREEDREEDAEDEEEEDVSPRRTHRFFKEKFSMMVWSLLN